MIAQSLKRSAERSKRRMGTPYQAAMPMLTFYINCGGENLHAGRRKILEQGKGELRTLLAETDPFNRKLRDGGPRAGA